MSAFEAHFVPGLQHAGSVVEVVVFYGGEFDFEVSIAGSEGIGVVPLIAMLVFEFSTNKLTLNRLSRFRGLGLPQDPV